MVRIGVVGFSRNSFDQPRARELVADAIAVVLARSGVSPAGAELVSGLTNMGVPRLAYQIASELGMRTVGVSAGAALRVRSGLYPVDEQIIVGTAFGDESETFLARIDYLIRVGGGSQSRREVTMFRDKLDRERLSPSERLIEHEVEWFGK